MNQFADSPVMVEVRQMILSHTLELHIVCNMCNERDTWEGNVSFYTLSKWAERHHHTEKVNDSAPEDTAPDEQGQDQGTQDRRTRQKIAMFELRYGVERVTDGFKRFAEAMRESQRATEERYRKAEEAARARSRQFDAEYAAWKAEQETPTS